ncbi:MAG: tyrosine-type recombinase/integrase [Acidaminobacter sp.]|uniref:tyrosine-type recombinase/integrase n=1 Tax=Acidaminobacter sp. TaxID=1872102 RepID=UPI001381200A|nr:tyrosine-type recombinase/integrase [Acidaminobacter sp.]MZQ99603.1 tyrosine-type recombinase/integrase [Acidaminobacter sp.]
MAAKKGPRGGGKLVRLDVVQDSAVARRLEIGLDMDESIEVFLDSRRALGLRQTTIDLYAAQLGLLRSWATSEGIKGPAEIDSATIRRYVRWAQERGNKGSSINTKIQLTNTFLKFLSEEGHITSAPNAKKIKTDKTIIQSFTEGDVRKLLDPPDSKKADIVEYRDYIIVASLLGTGLRLSSLAAIKISDIDFLTKQIHIRHTKNRKEMILPLSPTLEPILREWIDRAGLEGDDHLIVNRYGQPIHHRSIDDSVKRRCALVGVDKSGVRCSPHTLRHTFAKMAVRNGMDIFTLQHILGHSSIDMVRKYVHLLDSDIAARFTSPLDILKPAKQKGRKAIKFDRR